MLSLQFYYFTIASIFATAIFAVWKGDRAARLAGAFVAADQAVAWALHFAIGYNSTQEVIELMIDGLWAAGLLLLALRYASLWLGVAMVLQGVQFSLHAYYLVAELPHDPLHATINNIDNVSICSCIVLGTVFAIRRRARQRRQNLQAQELAQPPGQA